ncbi:MAG: hypothetical protein M5U01_42080 [Ardenticatenaceae bacterium]|nr:hypothetical protein [Ardenticatenaceae bacterium]
MPIIKRYSNRKLYDTKAKQYVTLERIAEIIRQGVDVHVVDHATGEDLTALTLTQIILGEEKKPGGFLPRTVLTALIQAGGDTLYTVKRALGTPAGLARQVDDEIERRIQALVNQGELSKEEGLRLQDKLLAQGQRLHDPLWPDEQALERALLERGLPARDELRRLAEQVDALAARLDQIGTPSRSEHEPSQGQG